MGKKKHRERALPKPTIQWWKRAWAKFALLPLGSILAVWTAYSGYKTAGAEELRTTVYQPLYVDVQSIERAVLGMGVQKGPDTSNLDELKRSGGLERLPAEIKNKVLKARDDGWKIHFAALSSDDLVLREISARLIPMRSAEIDRAWHQNVSQKIRALATDKGISDAFMFPPISHSARSRGLDVRDPNRPVVALPGGPIFELLDWVAYPQSVVKIEELWTDLDYLYFNARKDEWYYRVTREDMERNKSTLAELLDPVFELLREQSDFQVLLKERTAVISQIADLKAILADRIKDPKRWRDLITD